MSTNFSISLASQCFCLSQSREYVICTTQSNKVVLGGAAILSDCCTVELDVLPHKPLPAFGGFTFKAIQSGNLILSKQERNLGEIRIGSGLRYQLDSGLGFLLHSAFSVTMLGQYSQASSRVNHYLRVQPVIIDINVLRSRALLTGCASVNRDHFSCRYAYLTIYFVDKFEGVDDVGAADSKQ